MSALPEWLAATWCRSYIRRAPIPGAQLGEPDASVAVRYVQTLAGGHAFDLRIPDSFTSSAASSIQDLDLEQLKELCAKCECFAGVTRCEMREDVTQFSWHGAFLFPPALGDGDAPLAVLESIAAGTHETSDIGVAIPTLPSSRAKPVVRWLEHDPSRTYEEEWLLLESYFKQGAHLAAVRPAVDGSGACWLAILGNTFGFVRDIERNALPAAVRNRPLAETLADDSVPLDDKRRLLDCEFSFGHFGQGGGVGGVVELSSHPWRKGTALATLVGDTASGWEPVRPSDAGALGAALSAIKEDHAKACEKLRAAQANGQAEVAEMLKARGAVP